jgi:hypothetical protein
MHFHQGFDFRVVPTVLSNPLEAQGNPGDHYAFQLEEATIKTLNENCSFGGNQTRGFWHVGID